MSSKDFRMFRTNSIRDRLARLSVPKAKKYLECRGKGMSIEEALDEVAPVTEKEPEQLVLNTNQEKK